MVCENAKVCEMIEKIEGRNKPVIKSKCVCTAACGAVLGHNSNSVAK